MSWFGWMLLSAVAMAGWLVVQTLFGWWGLVAGFLVGGLFCLGMAGSGARRVASDPSSAAHPLRGVRDGAAPTGPPSAGAAGGRAEPRRGPVDDPALDVETVRAAVERHARLVDACFRRQQRDRVRRHVRRVRDQHVDTTVERRGQRVVEIAFMDLAADDGDVAAGARHRDGIDVDGVQLDRADMRGDRGADRTGATTHVQDDGSRRGDGDRVGDEELRTPSRDEDAGIHERSACRRTPPIPRRAPAARPPSAAPPAT